MARYGDERGRSAVRSGHLTCHCRPSRLFPGLAIALLVLGFNFVGDGLRDLTDPE
jgi:hypothetical protein